MKQVPSPLHRRHVGLGMLTESVRPNSSKLRHGSSIWGLDSTRHGQPKSTGEKESTNKKRIFCFGKSTSVKDTFKDPWIRVSGCDKAEETKHGANRRRKNAKLEIEKGAMDVVLDFVVCSSGVAND